MKIYLASASPRRKELLSYIFPHFETACSQADEHAIFHSPEQYVKELSFQKAENVYHKLKETHIIPVRPSEDILLIGADTIVFQGGKVLGKPEDKDRAFTMLRALSGQVHQVYTGVTLYYIKKSSQAAQASPSCPTPILQKSFYEKTDVYVSTMTDREILDYIASGDPFDKAGGYGIQGIFGKHISQICGDYYTVVGLPIHRLYEEIKELPLSD